MHDSSYFMPDGSKRCRFFRDLCQCQKKYGHKGNHEVLLPNSSIKEHPQREDVSKNLVLNSFF